MRSFPPHRLSKLLVATWLSLCTTAELVPSTRVINKPLVSLTLTRFGFTPSNRRAQTIQVGGGASGKGNRPMPWKVQRLVQPSCRDLETGFEDDARPPRTAFVRTAFRPPGSGVLIDCAQSVLVGRLEITATGGQLRQALTLRSEFQAGHINGASGVPHADAGVAMKNG